MRLVPNESYPGPGNEYRGMRIVVSREASNSYVALFLSFVIEQYHLRSFFGYSCCKSGEVCVPANRYAWMILCSCLLQAVSGV